MTDHRAAPALRHARYTTVAGVLVLNGPADADGQQRAPADRRGAYTAGTPDGRTPPTADQFGDSAPRRPVSDASPPRRSARGSAELAGSRVMRPFAAAIADAEREYQATGIARPVSVGAALVYPFGFGDARLVCRVLTACVAELEPGERLTAPPLAGDQARWAIEHVGAGARDAAPVIVVKPKQCGIATNLVLATDRRVYDIDLVARPCGHSSASDESVRSRGARRIRFYYPHAVTVPPAPSVPSASPAAANGARASSPAPTHTVLTPSLNRAYEVVRARRRLFRREPVRFPWTPAAVWDDGAHVYITLPPEAARHAAPVLYALEDDGSRALMNYTIALGNGSTTYVTDRTFRRAALMITSGRTEQRLVIENRAWRARGAERAR